MTEQPITCRDFISGMPLAFNAEAAGDLKAILYFKVTGDEPGDYFLTIKEGQCTFSEGIPEKADLTLDTPSDIWVAVSTGKLNGQNSLYAGEIQCQR